MKNKKTFIGVGIICFTILLMLMVIVIYGFSLMIISDNNCKNQCEEIGALEHQRIGSGSWDLKDTCICYFPDKIKAFRMEG